MVIANAIQDALASGNAPLAVFAAGLPQTPERVMEAASFTERFDFRVLDRLDAAAAERALIEPALALGITWDPAAAATALQAAGGSPYLIQLLGDETWGLATPDRGDTIAPAHATAAVQEIQESLAAGMFRGRWGKTTPQLSTARKALIDKGLIESAGTGQLRFTMPGFADFVRRHVDAPWYGPHLAADRPFDPESLPAPRPSELEARRGPRELPGREERPGNRSPR